MAHVDVKSIPWTSGENRWPTMLFKRFARASMSAKVDTDSRAELKFNVTLSSGRSQVMESSDRCSTM